MKNCSINYQCNKCKGKHNITICEGPRKLDPNTGKDCNLAPIIQDNVRLTTLNESRHSTLLQTAYSKVFKNELSLSSTAHIMFDSGGQKSYITVDLKKTYSRRLEDVFRIRLQKTSSRRLQDILIKTNIIALLIRLQKTSSRRLDQGQYICLGHTPSRHLQDVSRTSSRHLQDILPRRLQDVLQKRLQNIFKTSSKDVFKKFSRRIIRLNCLPRSMICLGDTSEEFMISVGNLQVW